MSNWKGREKDSSSNRNFNTAAYLGGTGTANVPPRSVKVVDFAKSRALEIKTFKDAINNVTKQLGIEDARKFRTFQRLPRYLRRRAMSHNIYRIPRRLRESAKREMEDTKDKKKVFRKHKRRPQYILQDYIRRQKEFVWLETHIWHAKRMKMGRLWGHKLALHCNEKSWKKSYKFAEYGCILYDASYYHVLQIQGKETSLLSFLKNVVNPNESSFGNLMYRFGTHQGKTILYEYKRFPFGALAPVTFLWKPNPSGESNDRVLWIWVHAAAFDQILKEIENGINQSNSDITIRSRKHDFLRFELIGPKSHGILQTILQLDNTNKYPGNELWAKLKSLLNASSLSQGCVIGLKVNDPRKTFPPNSSKTKLTNIEEALQCLKNPDQWSSNTCESDLWEIHEKVENIKQLKTIPILLIQHTGGLSRGYGSGWDLILPSGWGMAFWMSLVYAGGKAIGLEERSKILFEQGILDFPQNFPDTESYKQLSLEKYREAKKLYLKRPPGKRVNFEKIRVYYPFHSPWGNLIFGDEQNTSSLLEEPISISILFTSKPYTVIRHDDQLEELSNLLFPTNFNLAENENITKIKKQWVPKSSSSYTSKKGEAIYLPIPDYFKSSLVAVTLRFINKGNPSKHGMIYEPTQEDYLEWKKTNSNSASLDFKNTNTQRKVIGYICYGGFSYVRGCGYALGFCSTSTIIELFRTAKKLKRRNLGFVLVRNSQTTKYRSAILTIKYEDF